MSLEDEKEIRKKAGDKLRAQNDLYKMTSLLSEKKKEILKKIYKSQNDFYSPALAQGIVVFSNSLCIISLQELGGARSRSETVFLRIFFAPCGTFFKIKRAK